MRVAVLGTGTMGAGMAKSLIREGHDVSVWNRSNDKAAPLADDGARVDTDPAACVDGADAVLTMLFDEAATTETAELFLPTMKDGAVWLQCATVGPAGAKRLADVASEHGVSTLDCPVLGTKAPAESGKLTPLVSGPSDVVDAMEPVLNAIGAKTVRAGSKPGDGSALKLACNAMVATLTAAVGQSLAMASEQGLDPKMVLETLDGGPINAPYTQLKGSAMLSGEFDRQFAVDGVIKDVDLMIDAVPERTARMLTAVREAFVDTSAAGYGSDDLAAVITAFQGKSSTSD
ncbi:MAG: NAD(P)-dependent oxidoreductase [Rhodococcus sp. (in: high G+C Gram-positive bacteria)]